MSKFNIGDKVRICNVNDRRSKYNGKEVVITHINPNADIMKPPKPHYGVGEIYIFYENELELIPKDNTKIVITTDGNETLARLYDGKKVIKSATAKCSPDDAFDALVGAKIAFDRLIGEEKKAEEKPSKYKTGDKVRVIKNTCHHYCKIGETVTLTDIYWTDSRGRGVNWRIKEHGGYIRDCDFIPYTAEEEKPLKFKIGDTVKVVNNGEGYTTYTEWFEKYSPDLLGEFVYGKKIPNGTKCVIEKINRHVWWSEKLYAVRPLGEYEAGIYLIGEDGIARA